MKGRLKSIIVIIIAMVIAVVTGFYLVPRDVEKTRQTINVVRLKENIGKNQKIKNEHLEVIEIGSYNLPNYVVNETKEIVGKYATVPMYKGEFAVKDYFQDEKVPDDAFLYEDTLVDGISFETDLAKCVGGIPEKGDKVRVIIYKQPKDRNSESEVLIYDELSNMEVIKVANKDGLSKDEIEDEKEKDSVVPGVVTVKADIRQQQMLVKGIYDGVIHLALRPRALIKKTEVSKIDNRAKEAVPMEQDNNMGKESTNLKEVEKKQVEKKNKPSKEKNSKNDEGGFKIND